MVERDAVVEYCFLLVAEVAKAVPLAGGLRVERPDIIVDDPGCLLVDLFVELLAAEEWEVALSVEGPVDVDTGAGLNFACC